MVKEIAKDVVGEISEDNEEKCITLEAFNEKQKNSKLNI